MYLATVIDIASRRPGDRATGRPGDRATADHLRTDLVADALCQAQAHRRPTRSVIYHSDKGCQHTSADHTALTERLAARLSVGRTGQCQDNALAESLFTTLRSELLGARPWPTRATALSTIFEFIEGCYNLRRLPSSLGYRSPANFEIAHVT